MAHSMVRIIVLVLENDWGLIKQRKTIDIALSDEHTTKNLIYLKHMISFLRAHVIFP